MYEFQDGLWQAFKDLAGVEAGIIYLKYKKPPVIFIDVGFALDREVQAIIRQELKRRLRQKILKNHWIRYGWVEIELSMDELFEMLEYYDLNYGA